MSNWPTIDPSVKYRGVSELRKLNAAALRDLQGAIVVEANGEPLAVIVPLGTYMQMQQAAKSSYGDDDGRD